MGLQSAKDRLKKLSKALDGNKLLSEVLNNAGVKQQIIDLNQSQLYDKGLQADGSSTGQYSAATIYGTSKYEGKIQKGQPYEHVTLKDTGAFYDSMKVGVADGKAVVSADMMKEGRDLSITWNKALGLTDESYQILREFIKPIVAQILRKATAG